MAAMAMALVVALAMATLQTARRRRPYRIPNPRRDSHALQLHGALAAAARHPLRLAGRGHHFPHHADHVGRAGPAGRHAAAAVARVRLEYGADIEQPGAALCAVRPAGAVCGGDDGALSAACPGVPGPGPWGRAPCAGGLRPPTPP